MFPLGFFEAFHINVLILSVCNSWSLSLLTLHEIFQWFLSFDYVLGNCSFFMKAKLESVKKFPCKSQLRRALDHKHPIVSRCSCSDLAKVRLCCFTAISTTRSGYTAPILMLFFTHPGKVVTLLFYITALPINRKQLHQLNTRDLIVPCH